MSTSRHAKLGVALLLLSLVAGIGEAQEELRDSPAVTSRQARSALGELQKERAADFNSIGLGSALGLAAVFLIHAAWRRRPLVARIVVTILICAATARMLGLMMMYGDVNRAAVSTGIVWAFLTASLAFSFRIPMATTHRVRMPWLAVRGRPGAKPDEERRERPVEPNVPEPADEATTRTEAALALIEAGSIDEAVVELEKSIELRDTKRARVYLATILGARAETERALKELDAALDLDPRYVEALSEKHHVLKSLGRSDEAAAVKETLREARRARRQAGKKKESITSCPACEREVGAGDSRCECGLVLTKCGDCGREGADLKPRDGKLVCRSCRSLDAASHVKKPAILDSARQTGGMPVWMGAAAFSAAVVMGSVLSSGYSWWESRSAAMALRELARSAAEIAAAPVDGPSEEVFALSRRRTRFFVTNDFLKSHPASLKVALAVHAIGRSRELAIDEPALAKFVAAWGGRRADEAAVAVDSSYGERLRGGLWQSFSQIRDDLEREIEIRRARAATAAIQTVPEPVADAARDWKLIWRRPAVGTVFNVEAFLRVNLANRKSPSVVGHHADGAALAAAGVLRVEVMPSPVGSPGVAMVLRIQSMPFDVRADEEHPQGIPPNARIIARPGKKATRVYRAEYGPRCEFLALYDLSKEDDQVVATRASVHSIREIPLKSIPYYAPGLDETWEEPESQFRPYGLASANNGESVKQITRWAEDSGGKLRVAVGWLLRYQASSRKYTERVVQSWSVGRPWWDFYDNEVYFFRTSSDADDADDSE